MVSNRVFDNGETERTVQTIKNLLKKAQDR